MLTLRSTYRMKSNRIESEVKMAPSIPLLFGNFERQKEEMHLYREQ